MIWPRANQPWCRTAQAQMKTARPTAPTAEALGGDELRDWLDISLNDALRPAGRLRREHRVRREREEPRDVEVEPVREHELEAEQQHARQRSQLQRGLRPGYERERHRGDDDQHLEHALEE